VRSSRPLGAALILAVAAWGLASVLRAGGKHGIASARPPKSVPAVIWSSKLGVRGFAAWEDQSCPGAIATVQDPLASKLWATLFSVSNQSTHSYCSAVPTDSPRAQLVSPHLLKAGMNVYIAFSTFFPATFPTVPRSDFLQVAEMYGPPYGGPPTVGVYVRGRRLAVGGTTGVPIIWESATDIPAGKSWVRIVLHVTLSADPHKGLVAVWMNGKEQRLVGGGYVRHLATLVSGVNADAKNGINMNLYAGSTPLLGEITVYHRDVRIGPSYRSVAVPAAASR
jgi:hypothetical protein